MEIKIIDEQGEVKEVKEKEVTEPVTIIPDGILLHQQIGQLFNIDSTEVSKHKRKLNTLIDYAKTKTDDHSPEGLRRKTPALFDKICPLIY